jgi:periplasmic copper chaperone A
VTATRSICGALARFVPAASIAIAAGAMSACGGASPTAELAAEDAWARPTPTGATNGVVYLSLTTDVDDALVAASVDPSIADAVELHATTVDSAEGGHVHGGEGSGDVMSMGEVDEFALTPDEATLFEPGGNHIMLVDLNDTLALDDEFSLSLRFSSGRTLDVSVVVADNPPG